MEAVADGTAALEAVARRLPDVILTDLLMPEVSGFELVDRLAADPATRDVPVIVLTALDLSEVQRERLAQRVLLTARKGDVTSAEVLVAVERAAEGGKPNAEQTGPTVLVVDDHDLNRELARAILERRGYRVIEASSGAAGVEAAKRIGRPGAARPRHARDGRLRHPRGAARGARDPESFRCWRSRRSRCAAMSGGRAPPASTTT